MYLVYWLAISKIGTPLPLTIRQMDGLNQVPRQVLKASEHSDGSFPVVDGVINGNGSVLIHPQMACVYSSASQS